MGAVAGGHEREHGLLPGCPCIPGTPTLTEGPSTVIMFDVVDDNGLEEGGADWPAFPSIPMTKGKTLPSIVEVLSFFLNLSKCKDNLEVNDFEAKIQAFYREFYLPKKLEKVNYFNLGY